MSTVLVKRASIHVWTLADSYSFISTFSRRQYGTDNVARTHQSHQSSSYQSSSYQPSSQSQYGNGTKKNRPARRHFHDYFVTHLPVSSLHPDSRASAGPHHQFPRSASTPHVPALPKDPSPASVPPALAIGRETTVVRIPLRSAKHHFGVSVSRGTRPTNEDTYQAGVIELPAFAKRAPLSVTVGGRSAETNNTGHTSVNGVENRVADSPTGDPQVFYFGVFDGHGGSECSEFLRDRLHGYIQDAGTDFEIQSSLVRDIKTPGPTHRSVRGKERSQEAANNTAGSDGEAGAAANRRKNDAVQGNLPILQTGNRTKIGELEKSLVGEWRNLVGGYFRRFKPLHFSYFGDKDNEGGIESSLRENSAKDVNPGVPIEEAVEYAFLKADLDFVNAQVLKKDSEAESEKPLNEADILHNPNRHRPSMVGGRTRFKGGSTGSIAMISTPTPVPFWNPSAPSSLLVSHVGDTRILLCSTATGQAIPLTTDHHPSSPVESIRLQRYAATFVTDSFGEERMSGLANTRAFGDIQSKRIGVSAEPEIRRIELGPAEYSFMVLMSDGVSNTLTDQEVVDIIKEAKTPDQGARDAVSFATEVSVNADNATCLVVRLGGWERRQEGGLGSMGTKESRDWRKNEAALPRGRRP